MTAVIFPLLHRHISQDLFLRLCLAAYPLSVSFFPVIWTIVYAHNGFTSMAWALLALQMIVRRIGDFAATMLDSMVFDAIPHPQHLAMANSLALSSGVRHL